MGYTRRTNQNRRFFWRAFVTDANSLTFGTTDPQQRYATHPHKVEAI